MAEWTIYGKNGVAKATVKELELHDEWMAECFLTLTVKSAEPVSFAVGDYLDYRDERYTINYDPSVVKKARRDTYGEGFVYDNIKFVSVQDEIVRCDFNDLVLSDNKMHYTSLPTFPFYCETVDDLLDRIQANLEELYPGEWIVISPMLDRDRQRGLCVGREAAFINAYNEYIGGGSFSYDKTGVSITVDNINCWDAMKYVNDSFGLNFIVRGRVVIVGTVGLLTSKTFRYGKGNGLYELERISDSEQRIITRLRGYGAETNLPTRFYATLNQLPFAVVDSVRDRDIEGDKPFIDFNIDLTGSAYWTYQAYLKLGEWTNEQQAKSLGYLVTMRCGGYDVIGRVFTGYGLVRIYMEYSDTDDRTDAGVPVSVSDKATAIGFINAIHSGVHVYFLDRIKLGAFDKEHLEGGSVLPDNMAVNRLMLPGFPTKSLAQWVEEHDEDERIQAMIEEGFTFSTDPLRPYIDSPNKEYIGLRPGSLYFDGSNENEDIHPTIEGMEWGGKRCDVILDAEKIQDNGVLADDAKEEDRQVKVILPYGGFELDELKTDETTIEIKDGMCGARSLKVKSVSKTDEGNWECVCERDYDDTLHLYFPYSDFQIIRSASEPVHYVLTGIELPNSYVEAASEKLFYACVDALKQNHSPRFTFQPRIDELWMARQHDEATAAHQRSLHDTLKAGDIFVFTDEDLGIEGRVIIDVLSIKENGNNGIPTYEVTLRDEKVVSSIDKRLDKIASAVNSGLGGSGDGGGYSGRQTSSLIENLGSDLFLSKVYDDEAQGVIGFLKGAWFGAKKWMIDVLGNANLNDITFSGILRGGQAVINKIKSSNYSGDGMLDTGWQIINDYEGTNSKAVFDYLYIRKKAIFEELEIRKMTYIGGNFVFSPASGRIWRVEAYKNYQIKYDSQGEQYIEVSKDDLLGYSEVTVPYMLGGRILSLFRKLVGRTGGLILGKKKLIARKFTPEEIANMKMVRCYLFSDDGSTETMNWWKVGAQARCQTFNIDSQVKWDGERHTNVGTDVANTYWWRLVSGTGRGLCDDGEMHEYVDFLIKTGSTQGDKSVADAGSDVPMVGDQMVQMGHRTNPQYANVIIMETVGGDAPAFKEYRGIMGWDLTGKQKTKISPTTGTVMYSTAFHIETEYGDVLVPKDRGRWLDIPYTQGTTERRCYYYDRVEHNGSLWLCITPEGTYTTIEPGDSTPAQLAVWQRQVSKGDKGETSFKSMVFKRAASKPNKPADNEGSYASPVPSGWNDGIPSGTDTIWMTTRIFSTDGNAPQQSSWTDVRLMSDTESFDVEFSPLKSVTSADYPTDANRSQGRYSGDPDNIDTTTYKWFDPAKDNGKVNFEKMYWMATRTKENGIWGAWQVTKIKGEQGGFKSRAFCRTNEDISGVTPTGGTYTNPLPGNATTHKQTYTIGGKSVEITWYDGIPSGDEMLWSTVCTFYTEGGNDTWSKPARETDTSTQDIEFSPSTTKPNPPSGDTPFSDHTSEGWYDPSNLPSGETMIWRAERQVRNGAYSGDWVITRIYGEKGDPGTNATTTALKYTGPFATTDTAPTVDTWKQFTWTDNIPSQTEAKPNVYVGVWKYEAGTTLDITTQKPDSVSIFAHYGKNGTDGARGYNSATVYLYKRSATEITGVGFTDTLTYTFATGKLSSTPNGWSQGVPAANGNPLYVTVATAYANTNTDTIAYTEWATPVKMAEDGENSVRLALDNEHEDFLYSDSQTLPIAPSGGVTSQARIYDGPTEISASNATWAVDFTKSSGVPTSGTNAPTVTAAGLLTVPHITADMAKVVVKATYPKTNGKDYFAEFTGNKNTQDKYDLNLVPNAVAFNSSDTWTDKTITPSAKRTDLQGNVTNVTIQTTEVDGLRLYYGYVDTDGSLKNPTLSRLTTSTFTLTKKFAEPCIGVYFELRLYSGSNYRLCDHETVEIAKTSNGNHGINTATVFLYQRKDTAPTVKPTSSLTYTFSTGALSGSGLGDWTQSVPTNNGKPCWVIQATALSTTNTDVIESTEWSDVKEFVNDGAAGKNGTSIIPVPNSLVITQQKTDAGALPLSSITEYIYPVARDGAGILPITTLNITESKYCDSTTEDDATYGKHVKITGIWKLQTNNDGSYKTDSNGNYIRYTGSGSSKSGDNWVWKYAPFGSVTFTASTTTSAGQTLSATISVPFACNLLGTYWVEIEDDMKTEVASKVTAEITADGVLTTNNFDNKYQNASWGVKQDITKTINELKGDGTYDRTTGYSNSRLSTAEGNITNIKKDYYEYTVDPATGEITYGSNKLTEYTKTEELAGFISTEVGTVGTATNTAIEGMITGKGYSTITQTNNAINLKVNEISQTLLDTALGSSGTWEQGGIGNDTGYSYSNCKMGHNEPNYIRTKSLTPMTGSFKVIINAGYVLAVYQFGSSETLLRKTDNITGSSSITLQSDVYYVALEMRKSYSSNPITPDDVVGNFVTAAQLSSCGIDIARKTITMNADNMKFLMTSGDESTLYFDLVRGVYIIGGFSIDDDSIGSRDYGTHITQGGMYLSGGTGLDVDNAPINLGAGNNTASIGSTSSVSINTGSGAGYTYIGNSTKGVTLYGPVNAGTINAGTINATYVETEGDVWINTAFKVKDPTYASAEHPEDEGFRIWFSGGKMTMRTKHANQWRTWGTDGSGVSEGEVYVSDGGVLKVKGVNGG